MKLAEALQERADLKRNIANLRGRLERVVLVQEGEEPVEDPRELLKELDGAVDRLEYLMAAINHSNDVTEVRGMTLTRHYRCVIRRVRLARTSHARSEPITAFPMPIHVDERPYFQPNCPA